MTDRDWADEKARELARFYGFDDVTRVYRLVAALREARERALDEAAAEIATYRKQMLSEYDCYGLNCGGCELGRAENMVLNLKRKAGE